MFHFTGKKGVPENLKIRPYQGLGATVREFQLNLEKHVRKKHGTQDYSTITHARRARLHIH